MCAHRRTTTILMLADLDGQRTAHSALENYAIGTISGFRKRGLLVKLIDSGSRRISSNISSSLLGLPTVQRSRGRTVLRDHLNAIRLAARHFRYRKDSALFVINVARSYAGIIWLFWILGYPVVFWILDYYPDRSRFINRVLSKFSGLSICINSYVQSILPLGVPSAVFCGGTTLLPPDHLNRCDVEEPVRLFYAGTLNKLNAIDQVLEAVAARDGRLTLELYGEGELAPLAHQYAGKYPHISMHGLASREEVVAALNRAHVALCVRRTDDDYYRYFFPSKLIEMIASPAHIIASDMKEVTAPFKDALTFSRSHNARHILDAVDQVTGLTDCENKRFLEAKIRLVTNEFDWARISDLVSDVK